MKHREGKMAKYDAKEIADDAMDVFNMIDKDMDLPEWLEAKITKSADYMNSVKDYLTHHMKKDVQEGFPSKIYFISGYKGKKKKKESVYEKNKGKTLYGKDLVNYFRKDLNTPQEIFPRLQNKLKDVDLKQRYILMKVLTKQLTNSGYTSLTWMS